MDERSAEPDDLSLALRCFGVRLDVHTRHESDRDYLRQHFVDYLDSEEGAPDLRVWLGCTDPSVPFVQALMSERWEKQVHVDTGSGRELWERWTGHSVRGTPVPPFALPPLVHSLNLRHASAAEAEAGVAVIFSGPSRSGKSTMLLGMLERGWRFIADDTLPVDRTGRVHTYLRPVNIRHATVDAIPRLRSVVDGPIARRVETPFGTAYMSRPRDLGYPIATAECTVAMEVHLRAARGLSIEESQGGLQISGDITKHLDEASAAVIAAYDRQRRKGSL